MHGLNTEEREITARLAATRPDLKGLVVFRDGGWIAQCDAKGGTGTGATADAAFADMVKEIEAAKPAPLFTGLFTEDGLDQICETPADAARETRDLRAMGCTVNAYTAKDESTLYHIDSWIRDGVAFGVARNRVEAGQLHPDDIDARATEEGAEAIATGATPEEAEEIAAAVVAEAPAPVRYVPTQPDCDAIRACAKDCAADAEGRRDVTLEAGIRFNLDTEETAPDVNHLHVTDRRSGGNTDLSEFASWRQFRDGFELVRGHAEVDFYVSTPMGLACNIVALFDAAGLVAVWRDGVGVGRPIYCGRPVSQIADAVRAAFPGGEYADGEPRDAWATCGTCGERLDAEAEEHGTCWDCEYGTEAPAPVARSLSAAATPEALKGGYPPAKASGIFPLRALSERIADAIEESLELYSDPADPFGTVRDFVEYPEAREVIATREPGGRWQFGRNATGADMAAAFGADVGQWS